MAPRNPPWTMPAGLAKRSSARILQTVLPGIGLVHAGHPQGQFAVGGDLNPSIDHPVTLSPSRSSILEAWPIDPSSDQDQWYWWGRPPRTGPGTPSSTSTPRPPIPRPPGPSAPCPSTASRPACTPGGRRGSSRWTSPTSSAWTGRPRARGCWPRSWSCGRRDSWSPSPTPPASSTTASGAGGPASSSGAVPTDRPARGGWPGVPGTSGPCRPAAPRSTSGRGQRGQKGQRGRWSRSRTRSPRALLYRVTDAPLLRYLGVTPSSPRFEPTRFDGAEARARLAEVERDPAAAGRSRVSILLGNTATPQTLTATHTLWAMLGILPAGAVQRTSPPPERGSRPHHRVLSGVLLPDRQSARSRRHHPRPGAGRVGDGGGLRDPSGPVAQPPQRVGPAGVSRAGPRRRAPHLPPLPRHPVRHRSALASVPFASALSEHPVASAATGEVSGAVLERLGERPDLVVITTTRSHAGALEDIAGHRVIGAPPLGRRGRRGGVGDRHRTGGGGDPGHQPVGRVGRTAGPGAVGCLPIGRRLVALRRLARAAGVRTERPDPDGRPVHLSCRRVPPVAGGAPPRPPRRRRERVGEPRAGRQSTGGRGPGGDFWAPPGCSSVAVSTWRPSSPRDPSPTGRRSP